MNFATANLNQGDDTGTVVACSIKVLPVLTSTNKRKASYEL